MGGPGVKCPASCWDLKNPCPAGSLPQNLPSLSFLRKGPPSLHTTQKATEVPPRCCLSFQQQGEKG